MRGFGVNIVGLLLILFVVGSFGYSEDEYKSAFLKWTHKYQKTYSNENFFQRYQAFKNNMDFVGKHDSKMEGFSVALNQFADLTSDEFGKLYMGLKYSHKIGKNGEEIVKLNISDIPPTWDWRTQGAVTQVKNQGQCGSCWSFSATGSTEGVHFLASRKLVGLSEQNLVDCSTKQGNMGCQGGLMDDAFQYIIQNNGLDTEASYPYTATGPNQCQFNVANIGATLAGYHDIPSGSEDQLLQSVYINPVSVGIDASQQSFQFYSGGVYYSSSCSSTQLDHGVLAIGWGTDQGQDYWLVKNSWGEGWGLTGFIMMSRNKGNNCGIATAASFPCVNSCPTELNAFAKKKARGDASPCGDGDDGAK